MLSRVLFENLLQLSGYNTQKVRQPLNAWIIDFLRLLGVPSLLSVVLGWGYYSGRCTLMKRFTCGKATNKTHLDHLVLQVKS